MTQVASHYDFTPITEAVGKMGIERLATRLGCEVSDLKSFQNKGIDHDTAEIFATILDLTPAVLWGESWVSTPHYSLGPVQALAKTSKPDVLAKHIGCSTSQVHFFRAEGIPAATAERIALRLNLPPTDLWPGWGAQEAIPALKGRVKMGKVDSGAKTFSFEKVENILKAVHGVDVENVDDVAHILLTWPDGIESWRRHGVDPFQAQVIAMRLHCTPDAIWSEWGEGDAQRADELVSKLRRIPQTDAGKRFFPFAPIEDFLATHEASEIAQSLGVYKEAIYRFRERGLNSGQADALCAQIGIVPELLWPDWLTSIDETIREIDTPKGGTVNKRKNTSTVGRVGREWAQGPCIDAVVRAMQDCNVTKLSLRDYMGWTKTVEKSDRPAHSTVIKMCGTWNEAVRLAQVKMGIATTSSGPTTRSDEQDVYLHICEEPATVADLVHYTGFTKSAINRHVNKLFTNGLIALVEGADGVDRWTQGLRTR